MDRFDQRQGFLISATVHVVLLTLLSSLNVLKPPPKKPLADDSLSRAHRVMLPPAEVLRQFAPKPVPQRQVPAPAPQPQPTPPPEEARAKDRISVGAPSDQRAKQLILRKDEELTVPKGQPKAIPSQAPTPPSVATAENEKSRATAAEKGAGFRLPPGLDGRNSGDDKPLAQVGPPAPDRGSSIASSLKNLDRRIADTGPLGLPNGTGQQMGPLFFDPEGADFTAWLNHFKNEVYRNWIMPQPALMGFRGHVDIEFTVERNGAMSSLRLIKSSGTAALDRAAMNALQASRLMALPADFGSPRVTMQVSFFYNESPRES